jgi:xylulokinase
MPYYLGLDLSTQSLTAVCIDPDEGGSACEHSLPFDERFPHYGTSGGVIRGADGSVVSPVAMFLDALDALFQDLGDRDWPLTDVAGVSVSAQQHATVYLDRRFAPTVGALDATESLAEALTPCLTRPRSPVWLDQSTARDVARMRENLHDAGLPADYATTTSGSDYALRFPAAQIARFARREPAAYRDTARIHVLSSFLTSVLAGRDGALDVGDGAGTNLIRIRSGDGVWDGPLLAAAAPDLRRRLPPLAPSTERAGRVARYFRERYGLSEDCVVLLGTGDNPSSLIGCGASRPGPVVVSLGTSDTAFAALGREPRGGIGHVFGNPAGGWMQLVCFANGSLARERVRERCGLRWDEATDILLSRDLSELEVFLPFLDDEITPTHRAVPLPEHLPASKLLASFCLSQALNLQEQAHAAIGEIRSVLLTGGASRNDGLAQLYADVFQAPVERLKTPNSAALGAAKRAWQGCTQRAWEDVDAAFRGVIDGRTRHPDARRTEAIARHRGAFQRLR